MLAAGVACAALAGALPSLPASAAPVDQLTVYVSPTGTASAKAMGGRAGLTRDTAVSSIEQAQAILRARNVKDAKVLLADGLYQPTEPIKVDWSPPGGHLTIAGMGAAAVIDCSLYEDDKPETEYGVIITADNVSITNKTYQNCRNGGIRALGTAANPLDALNVSGNTFRRLGSKYQDGPGNGYGGVHATYTTRLRVEGNLFQNLENAAGTNVGEIHGVYVANYGSNTTIYGNKFELISGDPVRTRNRANNTIVDANMFWKTGSYAIFSDWRQNAEGCSTNGFFSANKVGTTTYNNDRWNEDGQGAISIVRVRLWGHDTPSDANLYGCSSDPITFSGTNSYVSTRPW
ncbi:right-handed parallel beta-helix repeat-containing protein [Micromonospora sp. CA-249363]|uniref:right-handed parallel beta-helix repeat-containing protein n=1 Tax=Micromonospora sp. CA-249363 TaxID=3239963 RepID=UPI003D8CBD86